MIENYINKVIQGDCLEVMKTLPEENISVGKGQNYLLVGDNAIWLKKIPDNSIDSIVTDPPAGISFMARGWDSDKGGRDHWIKWMSEVATECKRVLKPGGHAFVWAIPRTSHWTATAWENAGFEIRDVVAHVFGSGFPKSHNIEKALQKIQPERSSEFKGIGTALKPAREDWILMRKPLDKGLTIAENCLKWGTGGINIDESRVDYQSESDKASATPQGKCTSNASAGSAPDVDMSEVDYHGEKYWYKNEYKWLIDKWLNDEDYVWSELKENLETYDWCKVPEIDYGDRVLFDSAEGVCIRLYESKRKEFDRPEQLGRFPANLCWSCDCDNNYLTGNALFDILSNISNQIKLCQSNNSNSNALNVEQKTHQQDTTSEEKKLCFAVENVDTLILERILGKTLEVIFSEDTECSVEMLEKSMNTNLSISLSGNEKMEE